TRLSALNIPHKDIGYTVGISFYEIAGAAFETCVTAIGGKSGRYRITISASGAGKIYAHESGGGIGADAQKNVEPGLVQEGETGALADWPARFPPRREDRPVQARGTIVAKGAQIIGRAGKQDEASIRAENGAPGIAAAVGGR